MVNDVDSVVVQFLEWGQKRSPQLRATDIEVALLRMAFAACLRRTDPSVSGSGDLPA